MAGLLIGLAIGWLVGADFESNRVNREWTNMPEHERITRRFGELRRL